MTTATTNYATFLQLQDTALTYNTVGELVSIDPPEYSNPAIEATNHSSSGVREYIASMLMEMAPFKATLNYVSADVAPFVTKIRLSNSVPEHAARAFFRARDLNQTVARRRAKTRCE
jgi:hypothetical protein